MVKKLKALGEKQAGIGGRLFDHPLKNAVKDSAQQIWLAGMGAFAKAQAEGNKVFEALVRDGQSLQRKTQSATEERISEVTTKMTDLAGGLSGKATQHWDKLETIFEERVAKAQAEGNKVFEALVRDGQSLQRKTQSATEERISEVTTKMTDLAGGLSGKATHHWDKLETIFEERVAKALNRLGVPSAKDVEALMARIDALSASVASLSGTAPKAAAKTAPAKRAAAKPAVKLAVKPAVKRTARKPAKA